ncbi:MAG: DUF971 domain-containing protein [Candidatus Marinimicrobia bacterium]|jgi:DUF971 family protein|nr:DUF971 domain-containing protein [Candidatus Neomarinimicrobiota bacterium]MBT3632814.1 DUF971 domain-containing protein [Candidatus Neomarinimicrobiota bacterium]MBT3681924.1 DUF971 domain-containing protein [Candidatus Neomarinimicrobiota bacterium]MBT3759047.1 DUF971 domain-containing protein [Candidatus Neomarinimicrobiota bacterium]MBT3895054.1 DUF971 domain-containing protein [Candidatus Neomarinimicrobiota bacterium]
MGHKIDDIQVFPAGMAIKWDDNKESFIDYKTLRNKCPCAHCAGEKDVLGNVYIGPDIKKSESAWDIVNVKKVGHYAIQITWGDNHDSGIYTLKFLRSLDLSE